MSFFVARLNQELKFFDRELFARCDGAMINIYRYRKTYVKHDLDSGAALFVVDCQPLYVMSLSTDWTLKGVPVAWGIEPIMQRLKEIDGQNRDVYASIMEQREKTEKSEKRALDNRLEDIGRETRNDMKRAWNDYNVSQLAPKRKV
jgi:hypothetical protein